MGDNPYKDSPLVFRLPDGSTTPPTPEFVAEFKRQCQAAADGAVRPLDPGIHVAWDVFDKLIADISNQHGGELCKQWEQRIAEDVASKLIAAEPTFRREYENVLVGLSLARPLLPTEQLRDEPTRARPTLRSPQERAHDDS